MNRQADSDRFVLLSKQLRRHIHDQETEEERERESNVSRYTQVPGSLQFYHYRMPLIAGSLRSLRHGIATRRKVRYEVQIEEEEEEVKERMRGTKKETVALNLELPRVEKQIMFAGECLNVYRVLAIYRVVQFV